MSDNEDQEVNEQEAPVQESDELPDSEIVEPPAEVPVAESSGENEQKIQDEEDEPQATPEPVIEQLNYAVPDENEEAMTSLTTFSFVSPATFTEKIKNVHVLTNGLDQRVTYLEQQQKVTNLALMSMDAKLADILGPLFDKLSQKVDSMLESAETQLNEIITKTNQGQVPANITEQIEAMNSRMEGLESRPMGADSNEMKELSEKLDNMSTKVEACESLLASSVNQSDLDSLAEKLNTIETRHETTAEAVQNGKDELAAFRAEMDQKLQEMLEDTARLTSEVRAGVAAAVESAGAAVEKAKQLNIESEERTNNSIQDMASQVQELQQQSSKHVTELNWLHGEVDHLLADHHHHDTEESERTERVTKRQQINGLRKRASLAEGGSFNESTRPGFLTVFPNAEAEAATGNVESVGQADHIHRVAVADPQEVEEHRKLLKALVRKVNAQGRCLQNLVGEVKILDDRKEKAKLLQNDGIAVQCLSCMRPVATELPRLSEGLPGGLGSGLQGTNLFGNTDAASASAQATQNARRRASSKVRGSISFGPPKERPKSANQTRRQSTTSGGGVPFPLNYNGQSQTHDQRGGNNLVQGMTGGTGGGVFKNLPDGSPLTAAVAQYFPPTMIGTKPHTTPARALSPSDLMTEDVYVTLDADMDQFEHQGDYGPVDILPDRVVSSHNPNGSSRPSSAPPVRAKPTTTPTKQKQQRQQVADGEDIEDKWKTEAELERDGNAGWNDLM